MRTVFLFSLFLSALAVNAQKTNFQHGYIIIKGGDTLAGLVAWNKSRPGLGGLLYKKTESENEQKFFWDDLKEAYNSESDQMLKICTVKRHLEYIDNDYIIQLKDSVIVQSIPLTPLMKGGKLSLYLFFDNSPFYFVYDGMNMFQLVQKYRYLTRTERMFDYERGRRFEIRDEFKGLLAAYYDFSEDKRMQYILDNTLYEERSLKYLISKMNKKMP